MPHQSPYPIFPSAPLPPALSPPSPFPTPSLPSPSFPTSSFPILPFPTPSFPASPFPSAVPRHNGALSFVAPLPESAAFDGPLEGIISAPLCPVCAGTAQCLSQRSDRLSLTDSQRGLPGLVAWLPRETEIPSDSCALRELNSGAYNHPCLVLAESPCGHLVFCAEMTSFSSNGGIQEKYRGCHDLQHKAAIYNEYIAFREPQTVSHNQLGELDYAGPRLAKQSYANLDSGFWIEWGNLKRFGGRCLQLESLASIKALYTAALVRHQSRRAIDLQQPPMSYRQLPHSISPTFPVPPFQLSLSAANPASQTGSPNFVIPAKRNSAIAIKAPSAMA